MPPPGVVRAPCHIDAPDNHPPLQVGMGRVSVVGPGRAGPPCIPRSLGRVRWENPRGAQAQVRSATAAAGDDDAGGDRSAADSGPIRIPILDNPGHRFLFESGRAFRQAPDPHSGHSPTRARSAQREHAPRVEPRRSVVRTTGGRAWRDRGCPCAQCVRYSGTRGDRQRSLRDIRVRAEDFPSSPT